mmetsp:Transcript_36142/g.81227  ORF Transcript_36142/g.81227 Transcript_36142/m.81227 type:complete len:95 (-) Transcript_36142:293-577(-)
MKVGHNPSVKDSHEATVTIGVKGSVIRETARTSDMYATLNNLSHMASSKLRKYKDQKRNRLHSSGGASPIREVTADMEEEEEEYAAEADKYNKD